jgi:HprK-related kinase A
MILVRSLGRTELARRLCGRGLPIWCGPLLMRVGTTLSELVEPIGLLYADYLLAPTDELPDFDARVDVAPRWRTIVGRVETVIDGRAAFEPFRREHALPMLEWAMNWCVFTRPHQYLLLHSAVVARPEGGLLMSGEPGAGKSTLTAALAFRDWRLLSDEVAMIPPGTRHLLPLPRPIGLKNDSIDIIRTDVPTAVIGPATANTKKGTVAHVRAPAASVAQANEPAEAKWVLFPRFVPGMSAEIRRVSRGDALLRLGVQSFNYSTLGVDGFETLADVVDGCECFEMRYGSLADALLCVQEVTGVAVPLVVPGGDATR